MQKILITSSFFPPVCKQFLPHSRIEPNRSRSARCVRAGDDADPDWEAEMSLFRKRIMKPNQLETLRKMEEKADIGKV